MNRAGWLAGSQDEEIQGCIEPMGEEGTVGFGSWRTAGGVGAAVPVGNLIRLANAANRVMLTPDGRGFHSVVVSAHRLVSLTSAA